MSGAGDGVHEGGWDEVEATLVLPASATLDVPSHARRPVSEPGSIQGEGAVSGGAPISRFLPPARTRWPAPTSSPGPRPKLRQMPFLPALGGSPPRNAPGLRLPCEAS